MVGNDTLLLPRLSALYGVNILNIVPGFSSNIPIKVNAIWVRVNPSTQCRDGAPINLLCLTLCALFADKGQVFAAFGRFLKHKGRVCARHYFLQLWRLLQHDSPKQEGHRDSSARSAGCSHADGRNVAFKGQGAQFTLGCSYTVIKVSFETASTFKPGSILGSRYLTGLFKLTEYVLSNFCANFVFCSYQSHHSNDDKCPSLCNSKSWERPFP